MSLYQLGRFGVGIDKAAGRQGNVGTKLDSNNSEATGRPGNRLQTSDSFLLSALLALSGGFQDAYTYNVREHVFSNAQTGNIVLMSQHLMMGEFGTALRYLFPILAFAAGILLAEQLAHYFRGREGLHWRQWIVLIELALLFVVGWLPGPLNFAATMLVSFSCAMQVQAFRKLRGYGYASTMCIGNLRAGTESLSVYLRERDAESLRRALHYFGIILIFALGAGVGGVSSLRFGISAVWLCCVLLFAAFWLMRREFV